jgi:hypothetical protein
MIRKCSEEKLEKDSNITYFTALFKNHSLGKKGKIKLFLTN